MKKIAIDGRFITNPPAHGIARYSFELLRNLKLEENKFQVFVFVRENSFLKNEDACSLLSIEHEETVSCGCTRPFLLLLTLFLVIIYLFC